MSGANADPRQADSRRPSDRTIALGGLTQRAMSMLVFHLRDSAELVAEMETAPSRMPIPWLRSKKRKQLKGNAAVLEAAINGTKQVVEQCFYYGDSEKLNVWPIYEFFDQLRKEVEEGVLSRLKKMKSLDENGRNDEYASMTPLVQEMGKNSKEILKDVPIEARLTSA